jgi:hypothetical protein
MFRSFFCILLSTFAMSNVAFSQNSNGSALEARTMLEKAATDLRADQTAALAKFNDAKGPFRDRDLYVFCFDMEPARSPPILIPPS